MNDEPRTTSMQEGGAFFSMWVLALGSPTCRRCRATRISVNISEQYFVLVSKAIVGI